VRFITLFLFSFLALASDPFRLVKQEMKNGNFIYSLVILRNISGDNQTLSQRYFLEGICYTQVGDYSKAISKFVEVKKLNLPINDYYYELGKTLYFAKEYEKAKKSFNNSIKNKFQIAGSFFYLAKISNFQKDFRQAKIYIQQILATKNLNPMVIQEALFQLGELHLTIAKNELKPEDLSSIVSKHVLPYYEKALNTYPASVYSKKIEERVEMVKKKYSLL
jgi:tetratricopeptide (TPR) repeat protein